MLKIVLFQIPRNGASRTVKSTPKPSLESVSLANNVSNDLKLEQN